MSLLKLRRLVDEGDLLKIALYIRGTPETDLNTYCIEFIDRTPLQYAVSYLDIEVAHTLIPLGADVNGREKDLWTALHYVSFHGVSTDYVQLLLDNGANIDVVAEGEWSPLHIAHAREHNHIVKFSIEQGANVDLKNNKGETVRQEILHGGNSDLISLLPEYTD